MKSTTHKITITNPCHEDWNKMTPIAKGRFCSACKKEVVDFTEMSSTEVIDYFQKNKNTISCGRFLKTQVDTIQIPFDPIIFSDKTVFWQRFLFIILFCFGQELFNIEIVFAQELAKDSLVTVPFVESPQTDSSTLVIENDIDSNSIKLDSLNVIEFKPEIEFTTTVTTMGDLVISGGVGIQIYHPELLGWCVIEPKKESLLSLKYENKWKQDSLSKSSDSVVNFYKYSPLTTTKKKFPKNNKGEHEPIQETMIIPTKIRTKRHKK